jgi:hypothetical protein
MLLILFAALTASTIAPIWSNDFFWHSAAGSWIAAHRALPMHDPLAVASSREPWIDTEWLFQVGVHGLEVLGGVDAVVVARALTVAILFTWLCYRLMKHVGAFAAICVVVLAWYGARPWLRERPSTAGAVLLVVLVAVLFAERSLRHAALAVFAITMLWMNLHPSALLAPLIVVMFEGGVALERGLVQWKRILGLSAAATAALFVNPYGVTGVLQPFKVARLATLPIFRNQEWVATTSDDFRLFGIVLLTVLIAMMTSARRPGWIPSGILLMFLTGLAVRFARNQALFYAAAPLLIEPHLRAIPEKFRRLLLLPVALTALAIIASSPFRMGIDETKFPVASTRTVQSSGLRGNVLSTYGMGGYLESAFYPQRRVLNDGRNELFVEYQSRWARARSNPEAWAKFLDDYEVDIAYVALPPERDWERFFPTRDWKLVAQDEAAMVVARRSSGRLAAGGPAGKLPAVQRRPGPRSATWRCCA